MMICESLREFFDLLESKGELKHIKKEVDWNLELSHIAKLNEAKKGPALLFEKVKDYPGKRVALDVHNSTAKAALAFGLPPETRLLDLAKHWLSHVYGELIPPKEVKTGAKRKTITGNNVDLYDLPVPMFYPLDGGRYLCTAGCLITRNPHTGRVNLGTYRGMIGDRDKIPMMILPGRDARMDLMAYEQMGKPMPVAYVTGVAPDLFICSSSILPPEISEYDAVGALRGKPVAVTRSEFSDLPIPSDAEIVIEGEMSAQDKLPEGPFGEYTGYMSAKKSFPREYIKVKAISYRENPILCGSTSGFPVSDGHLIGSLNITASFWNDLQKIGLPGIKSVYNPIICRPLVIVSVKQMYTGHATQVALATFGTPAAQNCRLKTVILVDDDIDPEDMDQVLYAIGMRCQPERNVHISGRAEYPLLEPPIPANLRFTMARQIIDACTPYEWTEKPQPAVLDEKTVAKVRSRWNKYFTE